MGGVEVKKKRKRRVYSLEFKVEAVRRICAGENVVALSRSLEVRRSLLYYWLDRYREHGVERLRAPGRPTFEETVGLKITPAEEAAKHIAELERKVGQQSLEVDFLKRAFKHVKELRQQSSKPGGTASTERSGQ
jgi:transposase